MLGNLGHLFIIIAFVTILVSIIAYCIGYFSTTEIDRRGWIKFARKSFIIHSIAVFAGVAVLYSIIYFHQYQYEYAWKHSSNDLPLYFIVSSFWEGQEGSFLLWIFWNVGIGLFLIKTTKNLEMSTMAVFCTIQLFLVSMVLGIHITSDIKIGSSPFMLLKDTLDSNIYAINPLFIPLDGTGLNPLLQNIWMVIHPPVIFLGFALSGVPFSFALAALWENKPEELVHIMAPWVLACAAVLGTGIIMGAYWAYETLNFGGYWNWDPVENAVFVPWLIFLAAIHGMVLYSRKKKGLSLTIFMAMTGFILIVYSTFLTRSGILGNTSVHSFTDLGLSGQLLLFLIFFLVMAIAMFFFRRKSLREEGEETTFLSIEFWMILAVCLFCLSAFQILIPTSIPVFNVLLNNMGIEKNFAPPVDHVGFYSKFQLWFAIAFCLASALGQVFYWKKIRSGGMLENEIILPVTVSLILSSICIFLAKTSNLGYICLIFSAIYLIVVCIQLFLSLFKTLGKRFLGGFLAHIGMALMLLGFVYSAGHQKVLSQNITTNAPESNLPIHTVQKNLLLNRNVPRENNGYLMTYQGPSYEMAKSGDLLSKDNTLATFNDALKVVTIPADAANGQSVDYGDTVEINTENIYYTVDVSDRNGDHFTIKPRMQNNPTMGYIASPDIKSYFTKDIYTHITNFPDPEKVQWKETVTRTISLKEEFSLYGLNIKLDKISVNENPLGIPSSKNDLPLEATVIVSDEYNSYVTKPIYHIDKSRSVRLFPDEIEALGTKIYLNNVDPIAQRYQLSVLVSNRDWITIESIVLPFISLVWLGSIIMILGICVSLYFRILEAKENKRARKIHASNIFNSKITSSAKMTLQQTTVNV